MEKWLSGETWGTLETSAFEKNMAHTKTWGCLRPWAFDKPLTWLSFDTSLGIKMWVGGEILGSKKTWPFVKT
jgi:hypothetical protein